MTDDGLLDLYHRLNADEREIVDDVVRRLHLGRANYGAWVPSTDTRDYVREAWEEGIDLIVYLALARQSRRGA